MDFFQDIKVLIIKIVQTCFERDTLLTINFLVRKFLLKFWQLAWASTHCIVFTLRKSENKVDVFGVFPNGSHGIKHHWLVLYSCLRKHGTPGADPGFFGG